MRKFQYTTFDVIKQMLLVNEQASAKRLLINKEGVVVGQYDNPVCVMYLLDGHVAAYVMVSKHANKLVAMHESTVERLPNSKI